MFAFLFDEDHSDNEVFFGPQFASKIIGAIERFAPVPETRLLMGGLVHNLLVYEVSSVILEGNSAENLRLERSHNSEPNYNRRLSIICDLAETLSTTDSSFDENQILEFLARKNIWVVVAPALTAVQAREVHAAIAEFGPYLGYSSIDEGNPLHRRLFLESLFNDKLIGPHGLAFRRDVFDDDDIHSAFGSDYVSKNGWKVYDAEDFDARFPQPAISTANSPRGDLSALRLAGNDPGHRSRVAHELMRIDSDKITSPIAFSARKPADGIEFLLPSAKFTDYLLNSGHKEGGPKAKFFAERLDIQPDDWRYLADQILQGVKGAEFYRLRLSPFGASHGALVLVTGRNGKTAVIETGWRVPEEGPALFVTAYPADRERSKGLAPNPERVPHPNVVGKSRWAAIDEFANRAGLFAAAAVIPKPMVLERFGTIWEGECGFGWVQLPDGRTSFARWIVAQGHGYPNRPGVSIYSRAETQSVMKNRAYAEAYAEVLRSNGFDCIVGSRLD